MKYVSRDEQIEFMKHICDPSHIMTLTFNDFFDIPDKEAELYSINKSMNKKVNERDVNTITKRFLKEFSRKFYGKKPKEDEKLSGLIVREYQERRLPHFHILLNKDDKYYEEGKLTIEQHYDKLIDKFEYKPYYNRLFKFKKEHCDLKQVETETFGYAYFLKENSNYENHDFAGLL